MWQIEMMQMQTNYEEETSVPIERQASQWRGAGPPLGVGVEETTFKTE